MTKTMSLEAKIHAAEAYQEIESEYGLHEYCHANGDKRPGSTCPVNWSEKRAAEVVATHGFGGMISARHADENWTNGIKRQHAGKKAKVMASYPECADMDECVLAEMVMHTVCSCVIEVAEDGLSARSAFYTPGIIYSNINKNRKRWGHWLWERYGVDWVFEDGKWLYLSNLVQPDIMGTMDITNFARSGWDRLMATGVLFGVSDGQPKVDIPGPSHSGLTPVQVPQWHAVPPAPYRTLDWSERYIPKPGHNQKMIKVFDHPNPQFPHFDPDED